MTHESELAAYSAGIEKHGLNPNAVMVMREAGVDVFVAGSAVFAAPDPVAAIKGMRTAAEDVE